MVQLFLADKPEFQSTLPARGATRTIKKSCKNIWISIHAPRTGSDQLAGAASGHPLHFNPRSPHGERRFRRFAIDAVWNFNPRSPHGERREPEKPKRRKKRISIHAPRTGSDDKGQHGLTMSDCISIHAPRTGSDDVALLSGRNSNQFQSTLPARGATNVSARREHGNQISIHAPRTGSDERCAIFFAKIAKFQSTLPARGATRATRFSRCRRGEAFQSTLPARGATAMLGERADTRRFQSTLPARGATLSCTNWGGKAIFQSTLPARGATSFAATLPPWKQRISIHAPRTGSDWRRRTMIRWTQQFQSTLPARGATQMQMANGFAQAISIHAPRTGSD